MARKERGTRERSRGRGLVLPTAGHVALSRVPLLSLLSPQQLCSG